MKAPGSKEAERHLESLIKGLEVLDCIERCPESAATLAEIAEKTGLYKSRIIRVCGTLEHMGYLIHDRREKVYRLGPRTFSLGRAYEYTNALILESKPFLETLHTQLKLTASFYILRGMKRVCISKVSTRHGWIHTMEGEERELHYGSTGRIFLAFGPEELQEKFFAQPEPYPKLTPQTPSTGRQVWEYVQETRKKGYAATFEERIMGQAGVAVPVYRAGELAGALSVGGDVQDFSAERIPDYLALLRQEAEKLTQKLTQRKSGGDQKRKPVSG